jgi:hypothetical protein
VGLPFRPIDSLTFLSHFFTDEKNPHPRCRMTTTNIKIYGPIYVGEFQNWQDFHKFRILVSVRTINNVSCRFLKVQLLIKDLRSELKLLLIVGV